MPEVSKKKETQSSSSGEKKTIDTPNENDVLCGRGGSINSHPGNEHYRALVEKYRRVYLKSRFKEEKRLVAETIVEEIHGLDPPGRFLIKDVDSGKWSDIGHAKAREKTSQALRENAPTIRAEIHGEEKPLPKPKRKKDTHAAIMEWWTPRHVGTYPVPPSHPQPGAAPWYPPQAAAPVVANQPVPYGYPPPQAPPSQPPSQPPSAPKVVVSTQGAEGEHLKAPAPPQPCQGSEGVVVTTTVPCQPQAVPAQTQTKPYTEEPQPSSNWTVVPVPPATSVSYHPVPPGYAPSPQAPVQATPQQPYAPASNTQMWTTAPPKVVVSTQVTEGAPPVPPQPFQGTVATAVPDQSQPSNVVPVSSATGGGSHPYVYHHPPPQPPPQQAPPSNNPMWTTAAPTTVVVQGAEGEHRMESKTPPQPFQTNQASVVGAVPDQVQPPTVVPQNTYEQQQPTTTTTWSVVPAPPTAAATSHAVSYGHPPLHAPPQQSHVPANNPQTWTTAVAPTEGSEQHHVVTAVPEAQQPPSVLQPRNPPEGFAVQTQSKPYSELVGGTSNPAPATYTYHQPLPPPQQQHGPTSYNQFFPAAAPKVGAAEEEHNRMDPKAPAPAQPFPSDERSVVTTVPDETQPERLTVQTEDRQPSSENPNIPPVADSTGDASCPAPHDFHNSSEAAQQQTHTAARKKRRMTEPKEGASTQEDDDQDKMEYKSPERTIRFQEKEIADKRTKRKRFPVSPTTGGSAWYACAVSYDQKQMVEATAAAASPSSKFDHRTPINTA